MPLGKVDYWLPGRSEGAIVTAENTRYRFAVRDLVGLAASEIQRGMDVQFDVGPRGDAHSVRRPAVATFPEFAALDPQDPLFKAIPLPDAGRGLVVEALKDGACHPGLRLDKYLVPAASQEQQKQRLMDVVQHAVGDVPAFNDALRRRHAVLDELAPVRWTRLTSGPLTLHLARAAALENAGLCLHPIHGFAFLPGTGLKGLARAFAETVWLPAQADPAVAQHAIDQVFGHAAPGAANANRHTDSRAGRVVFHDAWPESWPQLALDIVNNHHAAYYQGNDAPGDWESPSMVYFLAVPAGQAFSFALSRRRRDDDEQSRALAREWLDGGLSHLGCGAKTAAGYGRFQPAAEQPHPLASNHVAELTTRVTLVTPAFLAGADQTSPADADLRPATLRGLLRWWWRTLHAGYVDVATLRALEASLWGDTASTGAIQLAIADAQAGQPHLYNYKEGSAPNRAFKRQHGLRDRPNDKTTQGLFYASYGMDDRGRSGQRFHLDPGASWTIRFTTRTGRYFGRRNDARDARLRRECRALISPQQAMDQARAALWLLCTFGAVGSKARKGFGSLALDPGAVTMDLPACEDAAAQLRHHLGLSGPFREIWAESPALGNRLDPVEVSTAWTDPWYGLDQVGFAYQAVAQAYSHQDVKRALGLPRKIHGPREHALPGQRDHQRPVTLTASGGEDRHASPVHVHLAPGDGGRLVVHALALPARRLPNLAESRRFLQLFLDCFRDELGQWASTIPVLPNAPQSGGAPRAAAPRLPRHGDRVTATLLADRTRKGGWRARHKDSGLTGTVLDSEKIPADKQPGDELTLKVHSVNDRTIDFRAE